MIPKDSNDDFTFTIEGKDYTISEKNNLIKKNQKQTLHIPSLTIGSVISGICIAVIFFGIGGMTESSEPLIEKQLREEGKYSEVEIQEKTMLKRDTIYKILNSNNYDKIFKLPKTFTFEAK